MIKLMIMNYMYLNSQNKRLICYLRKIFSMN